MSKVTYLKELRTLGDHLRRKRIDLGLLQSDVARKSSVDEDSVLHWETGYSHPTPYLMPRVIEFLRYAPWSAPASLGQWLLMARRANGLSQKWLAKKRGVDESTV